ncbi:hypothetical protein D3C76_1637420 [compost metagenome]
MTHFRDSADSPTDADKGGLHCLDTLHAVTGNLFTSARGHYRPIRTGLQGSDDSMNLLGRGPGTLRQGAHFVGDNRKTPAMLACPSRFNGRVQRQQIGLIGDRRNHIQHTAY